MNLYFDFADVLEKAAAEIENGQPMDVCPKPSYNSAQELFADEEFHGYLQKFWPRFAQIANNLCLQNGKLGQECGKMREAFLRYLLARYLGEDAEMCPLNDYDMDVVEKGKDVILFDRDVSIKTISHSGSGFNQLKISWVEDKGMADELEKNWLPEFDLLLCRLKWDSDDEGVYYIPKETQEYVVKECPEIGATLKTAGGYSKGTSLTSAACQKLVNHPDTLKVAIKMPPEHRDDNFLPQLMDRWYWEIEYADEYFLAC
jgi:hypothetical protein